MYVLPVLQAVYAQSVLGLGWSRESVTKMYLELGTLVPGSGAVSKVQRAKVLMETVLASTQATGNTGLPV